MRIAESVSACHIDIVGIAVLLGMRGEIRGGGVDENLEVGGCTNQPSALGFVLNDAG